MEITKEQIKELLRRDGQRGDMGDVVQRMLDNPDRYNDKLGRFGRIYHINVNYDLGFDRLLKAADQNGGVNSEITAEHFPIERKGIREVAIELYEFDRTVKGPEPVEEIEANGYQLEGVPELLAFAAANPMEQLRRPVVQFRDRWQDSNGDVCVPGLDWGGDVRYLNLYCLGDGFCPYYRFLVSRK